MNKVEFEFLNVNIMAIANRIFSKKSDTLIADMMDNLQASEDFDYEADATLLNETMESLGTLGISGDDSDTLLEEGYNSLEELKPQFTYAYEKCNSEKFSDLLNLLPELQIDLKQRLTGSELESCIDVLEKEENEASFNDLHMYSESLFHDPSEDLIMQCLAEEDINILLENEDKINNNSISFENMENAVIFNTLDILEWFSDRYYFEPNDKSKLIILAADDGADYFEKVLTILKPDEGAISKVLTSIEDQNLIHIVKSYK